MADNHNPQKHGEDMRINRWLSHHGICSRREADRWITEGRILINNKPATLGDRVVDSDRILIDGKPVSSEYSTGGSAFQTVVLAYHKPIGVICTTSVKERPNLTDVIDYPTRLFPIGRLDKDSSGLLLLTNDGMLADYLARARNHHEKEYVVTTDKPLTDREIRAMEQGIPLEETMTAPCRIFAREQSSFHIILTQGLNRQIRRMCEYFDRHVVSLKRIRFVTVFLDGIEEGSYRELTEDEIQSLR